MRPTASFLDFLHHMLCAAGPIATLAVPEANHVDLVRAEARGRFEHPEIVAFVRVLALSRRTNLKRRHMQRSSGFGDEEARTPIAVGEIDRLLEKGRLLEGKVNLEPDRARERRLREQKIAAARAA